MNKLTNENFDGDCSFLPFAAELLRLRVPMFPNSLDFQNASLCADDSPVRRWHAEAIRFRLHNPGSALNLDIIAKNVCASIYKLVTCQ